MLQLRWVVESVNGRLKTWNYLSRTIPNTQIPHIGDYVRIVSALCNKFRPDISTGIEEDDAAMVSKMRHLADAMNELKDYSETNGPGEHLHTIYGLITIIGMTYYMHDISMRV